jgi:hypothetical protein
MFLERGSTNILWRGGLASLLDGHQMGLERSSEKSRAYGGSLSALRYLSSVSMRLYIRLPIVRYLVVFTSLAPTSVLKLCSMSKLYEALAQRTKVPVCIEQAEVLGCGLSLRGKGAQSVRGE